MNPQHRSGVLFLVHTALDKLWSESGTPEGPTDIWVRLTPEIVLDQGWVSQRVKTSLI